MTIKQLIVQYLEGQGDWTFGGKIEDHIRSLVGAKASNASRRCRELENDNAIERRLIYFEGKQVVQYRIKQEPKVEKFASNKTGIFYEVVTSEEPFTCNCKIFSKEGRDCTHIKDTYAKLRFERTATLFS